jgi:hypothetical protein
MNSATLSTLRTFVRDVILCYLFIVALLALGAVSGCASGPHPPPPPEPAVRTVVVDRPVAVACIKEAPARPDYASTHLPPGASDLQAADALAGDWLASRGYERTLENAVRACLQPIANPE